MLHMPDAVDLLSRGAELLRNHAPLGRWGSPSLVAGALVLAGLVLALRGARLLRPLYVLAFMAIGAVVGVHTARTMATETLLGFLVGAGVAALVGYLLYRWWIGVTAGLLAAFTVAAFSGGDISGVRQAYQDQMLGVGTGQYAVGNPLATASAPAQMSRAYAAGLWGYARTAHTGLVRRLMIACGAAFLLGVALGVALPQFTAVLGTSLLGVLGMVTGLGVLASRHWPALWAKLAQRPVWVAGAAVGLLLLSVIAQAGRRRPEPAAAAPASS